MKSLFALLFFLPLIGAAQPIEKATVNPYRKIGARCYYLQPRFDWQRTPSSKRKAQPAHLKEWLLIQGKVIQLLGKEGILAESGDDPIRVRNWPGQAGAVDGDRFVAFVLPDRRYQYKSTDGSQATVPSYDYGTVITQAEFAEWLKESAQKKSN